MYGNSLMSSSLSLGKIVSGLSKTLNIANQVIPIYKKAKPLISNFGSTMKLLKTFQNNTDTIKKEKIIEVKEIKEIKQPISNTPKFFI